MKRVFYVFCAAWLMLAVAGRAQEERHRRTAEQLLEAMDMETMLSQSIEGLFAIHMRQNPDLAPYQETVLEFLQKHMSWENVRGDFVTIYSQEFSEEELTELTAFYQTPTGQKAARSLPSLMAKGADLVRRRVQGNIDELRQELARKAQELEQAPEEP